MKEDEAWQGGGVKKALIKRIEDLETSVLQMKRAKPRERRNLAPVIQKVNKRIIECKRQLKNLKTKKILTENRGNENDRLLGK